MSIAITYGMTLLSLIAFVYLLFAYQNYLNKTTKQGESIESEVPLAQTSKGSNVPTQEKTESFEPPIFIDSGIKAESPNSFTSNEEQQSLNGLSSSIQEISSLGNEDRTIENLGENRKVA